MRARSGKKSAPRPAKREPIQLKLSGAVAGIVSQALATDAVLIALRGFCEGRGLEGVWRLEIQRLRLTPVPPPIPEE